jgi:hypothetical protein
VAAREVSQRDHRDHRQRVYFEPLSITLERGRSLQIRAANKKRPIIFLRDVYKNRPEWLGINSESGGCIILDGLLITGRSVRVTGKVEQLKIRHCTLVPGWGIGSDCEPLRPAKPSLELYKTNCRVIVGQVQTHAIAHAEDSIFTGLITVKRRQFGCVRFCYVPPGSRTPSRFQCQPDLVEQIVNEKFPKREQSETRERMKAAERLRVQPRFNSVRYGKPGYCNGSIVATYKAKRGDDLIVSGLRDSARWFSVGQWVEITHDGPELKGKPGVMAKLTKVDGETLTMEPKTAVFEPGQSGVVNPKVRRWDHQDPSKDPAVPLLQGGAILIKESSDDWIDLEDGIRIQFQPSAANELATYRTGDYCLIPAHVATGDIEWPGERGDPAEVAPHGIEHHYAPIAIISLTATGALNTDQDLRHKFLTLAECNPQRDANGE